jgi:hypothetical protein
MLNLKTENIRYRDLPSLPESTFEFQGKDKFWRPIRGRVRARTESEAKKLVKEQGLRWPTVWLQGTEPWISIRWSKPSRRYSTYMLPTLKLKHKNDDTVTYGDRNLLRFISGFIFCLAGIGLSAIFFYYNFFRGKTHIDSWEYLDCLLCGIALLAVSCVIFLLRFELHVDRRVPEIVIRARIIPLRWRCEMINARHAEKVVLQEDVFYSNDDEQNGDLCYVVRIFIAGKEIQLDYNSSRKAEFELGQDIAECLNIPFVCEDEKE